MSDIWIIVNTAVAILAVVVMIVRFKFNPVVSLVIGSAYLGLATRLGVEKTIDSITTGFGDIMARVGLLIAFGVGHRDPSTVENSRQQISPETVGAHQVQQTRRLQNSFLLEPAGTVGRYPGRQEAQGSYGYDKNETAKK